MPKEGVYRVTWVVNPKTEDELKMSELVRDVDSSDAAVAVIRARYKPEVVVKITGVAQLR